MFWLGWVVFTFVAVWTIPAVIALTLKQLLPYQTGLAADPDVSGVAVPWPSLSIIVPARNEEAQIRNGLTTLLQSTGVEFEIIAVDDRSTDSTGRIMDEVAATDARLKVIHVTLLPDGWLGKNHAMHVASEHRQEICCCSQMATSSTNGQRLRSPCDILSATGCSICVCCPK